MVVTTSGEAITGHDAKEADEDVVPKHYNLDEDELAVVSGNGRLKQFDA